MLYGLDDATMPIQSFLHRFPGIFFKAKSLKPMNNMCFSANIGHATSKGCVTTNRSFERKICRHPLRATTEKTEGLTCLGVNAFGLGLIFSIHPLAD
jgi:hypothetical protein